LATLVVAGSSKPSENINPYKHIFESTTRDLHDIRSFCSIANIVELKIAGKVP